MGFEDKLTDEEFSEQQGSSISWENFKTAQEVEAMEMVSPGSLLVRMEAKNLRDESVIDKKLWEPLLGEDLHELWDNLLQEEGDQVLVRGSTIIKMLFGGYEISPDTYKVLPGARSDLDITVGDKVKQRVNEMSLAFKEKTYGKSFDFKGLEIDFTDWEEQLATDIEAVLDLTAWLDSFPEMPEEARVRIGRKLASLRTRLGSAQTIKDYFGAHNLFDYEGLGVTITRQRDGNIEARVSDTQGFLSAYMSVAQLSELTLKERYDGFVHDDLCEDSLMGVTLDAMQYMEGAHLKGKYPYTAIANIFRIVKSTNELDFAYFTNIHEESFYSIIYDVSKRLASGDNVFEFDPNVFKQPPESLDEWLKVQTQNTFARASAFEMTGAFSSVFYDTAFGGFISPEVQKRLEDWHVAMDIRDGLHPSPVSFHGLIELSRGMLEIGKLPGNDTPPGILLRHMGLSLDNSTRIQRRMISLLGEEEKFFWDSEQPPSGMSEAFALMYVAVGMDPEKDRTIIEEEAGEWTLRGEVQKWWRHGEYAFDMSVDPKQVVKYMKIMKEKEEAWNDPRNELESKYAI